MTRVVREWLLVLSIVLLTIPGFSGFEMRLGVFRLGLFQPFKFVFIFWFLLQAFHVLRVRRDLFFSALMHKWSFSFRKHWLLVCLLIGLFLFDLGLMLGLITESGGPRGWGIYTSLLLGQVAGLLCLLDPDFAVSRIIQGIALATAFLLLFSAIELLFPRAALTVAFLKLVRDSGEVSFQLGSSLSTSALSEFSIRSFPLVVFALARSRTALFACAALLLLGILTLQKATVLSFFLMLGACIFLGYVPRKHLRHLVIVVPLFLAASMAFFGPEKMIGRFLVTGFSGGNTYANLSQESINQRKYLFELGMKVVGQYPLLGIGLEGFGYRNINKLPPLEDSGLNHEHVHNLLLDVFTSGGIVALLGFCLCLFAYIAGAWQRVPRGAAAIIFLCGQLPSMFTDSRIHVSWLAISLFWFGAMAWCVDRAPFSTNRPITR